MILKALIDEWQGVCVYVCVIETGAVESDHTSRLQCSWDDARRAAFIHTMNTETEEYYHKSIITQRLLSSKASSWRKLRHCYQKVNVTILGDRIRLIPANRKTMKISSQDSSFASYCGFMTRDELKMQISVSVTLLQQRSFVKKWTLT